MSCSFLFLDYALAAALRGTEELLERGLTYDVICKYLRGLIERFLEWFPDLVPVIENLKCCLPKFHSHAHQLMCQVIYALCYAEGFGLTHREGVETPWAELNISGLSTREMTPGGRHDSLNDLFNFWNRRKLEGISKVSRSCRSARLLMISLASGLSDKEADRGARRSIPHDSILR